MAGVLEWKQKRNICLYLFGSFPFHRAPFWYFVFIISNQDLFGLNYCCQSKWCSSGCTQCPYLYELIACKWLVCLVLCNEMSLIRTAFYRNYDKIIILWEKFLKSHLHWNLYFEILFYSRRLICTWVFQVKPVPLSLSNKRTHFKGSKCWPPRNSFMG